MSLDTTLSFIQKMTQGVQGNEADDIALQLLQKMQQSFEELYRADRKIAAILTKIEAGTATHMDTQAYAARVGDLVSTVMVSKLNSGVLPDGKMYYNIAQRTILPAMQTGHQMITTTADEVERELRRRAGIGINPRWPGMDEGRVKAIIEKACSGENFDDVAYVLDEPVKNTMQSFVDDFVRNNAGQLKQMGMRPKITRRVVGSCCEWCAALAGTYDYGTEPKPDFYRRHDHCRCAVIYDPGTGKVQDAHSRKWYAAEPQVLRSRREQASLVGARFDTEAKREQMNRLVSDLDEDSIYSAAIDGRRHGGVYREAIRYSDSSLRKSISSRVAQVKYHADKIADPEAYIPTWKEKAAEEQAGILQKWEKDMRRNAEQASVEIRVWKERHPNE